MSKFHISKDGVARKCSAQSPESCKATPSDQKEHYESREEAQAAYEKLQPSPKPLKNSVERNILLSENGLKKTGKQTALKASKDDSVLTFKKSNNDTISSLQKEYDKASDEFLKNNIRRNDLQEDLKKLNKTPKKNSIAINKIEEKLSETTEKIEGTVAKIEKVKKKQESLAKKINNSPSAQEQYDDSNTTSFELDGASFDKNVWAYDDLKGAYSGSRDTVNLYAGSYEYSIQRHGSRWEVESYEHDKDGMISVSLPGNKYEFYTIDDSIEAVLKVARKRYEKITSKQNPTDDDFNKYLAKGKKKQKQLEEEYAKGTNR